LRDYSDTDDLIPKPVLEKAAERMEDLEGAINNILKHEPEKPTCSMCGENPRGVPAKDGGWTTCPKCLPKENMAEFVKGIKRTGLLEAIDLIENSGTCDSLKLAVSKIKHEQDYIESQERNAAASEIIIGDVAEIDAIRIRKHLLLERARITKCLKREEKLHTDFQKRYKREEYSGWIKDISIPEFSKQLYWVNESIKALDKVESQERNAAASEIIIGDLTKKIEGMEAKDGQK